MSLTLIAILAAVWLALLVVVWALCVAAGRADRGGVAETATADDEPLRTTPEPPAPVVVDNGRLTRQLEATAELVGASKVALESRSAGRSVELAAAPEHRAAGQQSVSARVTDTGGSWVELVAHRSAGQPAFSDEDIELLAGVASLLARKTSFSPVERSDRFARSDRKTSAF